MQSALIKGSCENKHVKVYGCPAFPFIQFLK